MMVLLRAPHGIGRKEVAFGVSLGDFSAHMQEIEGFVSQTENGEPISVKVKD